MADRSWLVTKRKRNRDIRDFIVVHGKIIKPCLCPASPSPASSYKEIPENKKRQVPLPQLERRNERESKISASLFSKGVRKKTPLTEIRQDNLTVMREGNGHPSTSPAGTHHQKTCPALERSADLSVRSIITPNTACHQKTCPALERSAGKENTDLSVRSIITPNTACHQKTCPALERSAGKENTDLSVRSIIPNTAWKGKRSAVRQPLTNVPSSSSGCDGECTPEGKSTQSFPPITMATIPPAVQFSSNTTFASNLTPITVADTSTHHPIQSHTGRDKDTVDARTLLPRDVHTHTPTSHLFDHSLSLSLPDSPQTPSLTLSWDTERLLAELSNCERL